VCLTTNENKIPVVYAAKACTYLSIRCFNLTRYDTCDAYRAFLKDFALVGKRTGLKGQGVIVTVGTALLPCS